MGWMTKNSVEEQQVTVAVGHIARRSYRILDCIIDSVPHGPTKICMDQAKNGIVPGYWPTKLKDSNNIERKWHEYHHVLYWDEGCKSALANSMWILLTDSSNIRNL